jgi:hypothetical protein
VAQPSQPRQQQSVDHAPLGAYSHGDTPIRHRFPEVIQFLEMPPDALRERFPFRVDLNAPADPAGQGCPEVTLQLFYLARELRLLRSIPLRRFGKVPRLSYQKERSEALQREAGVVKSRSKSLIAY